VAKDNPQPAPPPPVADASLTPEHDARVASALARVPKIADAVAAIRQLPLKHPVPAAIQGQDDFRAFLDAEVKKEMPADKAAASVRALVRLGFLKESVDLGRTVEDAMLSQAGAYYDPDTKKFYIVLVPEDEGMLDVMSAHELTHALDDQYTDLGAYTGDPKHQLSNDEQQARRLVGEGDATLVMLAYQAKVAAHQDMFDPKNRRVEQATVAVFAAIDSEQLAAAAAANPGLVSQMGPSLKASIDAMQSIPPFILDPLFGAYTKGCAAVAAVRDAGGWAAVDALYANPPESTEQLLHPAEKLIAKREHPVKVAFAPLPKLLAGKSPLDEDVIGELTMAVYFKVWGDRSPSAEVTGWGGDKYVAYDLGGSVVAAWFTTWDTPKDAARFARAYEASFGARFPGEPVNKTGGHVVVTHADGTATSMSLRGQDVAIVDGAPSAKVGDLDGWLTKTTKTQAR
jgi:hypothetical protein